VYNKPRYQNKDNNILTYHIQSPYGPLAPVKGRSWQQIIAQIHERKDNSQDPVIQELYNQEIEHIYRNYINKVEAGV
jgi:hypothetical protein